MIETLVKGLRYWKPCCSNLQIYLQFIDFNVPLYCICLSLGWLKRLFQQLANLTAFHFFVLYMPSSLSLWWFKLLIAKSLVDWNSCYKPTTCKYPCTALLSLTMDHSKCVPQENAKPICLIYQFSAIKFGQIKGHLIYVSLKQQCLMPATMYIVLHTIARIAMLSMRPAMARPTPPCQPFLSPFSTSNGVMIWHCMIGKYGVTMQYYRIIVTCMQAPFFNLREMMTMCLVFSPPSFLSYCGIEIRLKDLRTPPLCLCAYMLRAPPAMILRQ